MVPCDPEAYLAPARIVLREDLEGLARGYSEEERIELWNEVRSSYRRYLRECSAGLDRGADTRFRGEFRLAMLLLAASFRARGEEHPEITGLFTEEEYTLLRDFEEMKEIDYLSVSDIVELIERREGKVYEIVKKYYERQYHLLDKKWSGIMGSMALTFSERYKERRRKIEEAVIEYIRRRPLTIFIAEIEEAIRKVAEAAEERRRAEEEAAKAKAAENEIVERLAALSGAPGRSPAEERGVAAEELAKLAERLEEAVRRLSEKERELEELARRYREGDAAYEALKAEAEALRSRVAELERMAGEYRAAAERLRAEKEAIEERLKMLEAAVKGGSEGHLVTAEEAWAMEEGLIQRILRNMGREVEIYDPVRGRRKRVRWSRKIFYSLHGEGRPRGRGVLLVSVSGVLRKRRDVVVDAVTLVHADAYRSRGWDSRPASLGELLELLEARLEEAGREDCYHILIVSSPTGWSRKALEYVVDSRSLLSLAPRNLTVYLVDPVAGSLYYNKYDRAAVENWGVVEPRIPEERLGRVVDYMLSEEAKIRAMANSAGAPFLRAEDVMRATGEDAETVRRAMAVLEERGVGRVMVGEKGVVAFFYERLGVGDGGGPQL